MTLKVLPVSADKMADLDALFLSRGCSAAKNCYCMYYRLSHRDYQALGGGTRSSQTRAALLARLNEPISPGLIAYQGETPVSWVSLGPRETFRRLETSPTMKPVDAAPVWSIVCFVVPSAYRNQGVAHGLLAAAIDFAGQCGAALLEAYPVDRQVADSPDAAWFGSLSMFEKAGFVEVARRKVARPVVRLSLPAARR